MIRILFFLLVVFLLGLGFAWLADRPGDMVVTLSGYQYRVSLMVAAVAVVTVVAAVMILWWLLKAIWTSPYTVARYFRVRRRDRGYQALSTGMIAAGAGDFDLARRKNREAMKLIRSDQEPLIQLLDAQVSLLEGRHDEARQKFEAMAEDPEMKLLGLRGLYLEAERLGDREAARHYAARAAEAAPQLGWAADSTIEQRIAEGDWDGALKILDAQKSTHQVDRELAARRRSVLLTAKANALFDTNFAIAKAAALEANRLRPDFVPAALVAARALFRESDLRKGAKVLEAAWKATPHPGLADLYVHARHGDSVNDRLVRAKKLQSLRQNNAESALAVARAALDAGDYSLAREQAESAIRMQPREGAWLLLADTEEAETGDVGKVREYLAKAVRAPRDPAWVADGYESDRWAPVSPVTGRLDAFEWRVPVERLGALIEADRERAQIEEAPALAAPLPVAPAEPAAAPAPSMPAPVVAASSPAPRKPEPHLPAAFSASSEPVVNGVVAAESKDSVVPPSPQAGLVEALDGAGQEQSSEAATQDRRTPPAAEITVPMPPDDPGVDPLETVKARRRFGLF
ncbi:heme biosynthesis protein HemY [Pseudaminobacter sp. 19-2017]|uniref:Heme biosynthesis protein HemY n=1 Tax=Pseudaminobacter soli (ex Zhang et al. 2022) TaxID=2831468 RepID=A0A942E2T4_9HYPH|nr:heme biosynthesis protein HemY [Pseudaminobacter soli]MBS3649976.1 heme biosynthesis protein HemY [Pseudaminobacter soli]